MPRVYESISHRKPEFFFSCGEGEENRFDSNLRDTESLFQTSIVLLFLFFCADTSKKKNNATTKISPSLRMKEAFIVHRFEKGREALMSLPEYIQDLNPKLSNRGSAFEAVDDSDRRLRRVRD